MIARRVGEKRYDLWFAKNTKLSWDDDKLVVGVPNRFFQEWLQSTFVEHVRVAASSVLGRPMQVHFAIDPELFQAARRTQLAVGAVEESPAKSPRQQTTSQVANEVEGPPDQPDPSKSPPTPRSQRRWHRLSDFVAGPCNRVAHASAVSVVESPAEGANP